MGDRANIVLNYGDNYDRIYLYTHWKGYKIEQILKQALIKGKSRWDDVPYFSRVIFCELIGLDEFNEITGFGLTPYITDGDDRILEIDLENKRVMPVDKDIWLSYEEFILKAREDLDKED